MTDENMAANPQVRPLIYAALSRLCGYDTSKLCDVEVEESTLIITLYPQLTDAWRRRFQRTLETLGAFRRTDANYLVYTMSYHRLLED